MHARGWRGGLALLVCLIAGAGCAWGGVTGRESFWGLSTTVVLWRASEEGERLCIKPICRTDCGIVAECNPRTYGSSALRSVLKNIPILDVPVDKCSSFIPPNTFDLINCDTPLRISRNNHARAYRHGSTGGRSGRLLMGKVGHALEATYKRCSAFGIQRHGGARVFEDHKKCESDKFAVVTYDNSGRDFSHYDKCSLGSLQSTFGGLGRQRGSIGGLPGFYQGIAHVRRLLIHRAPLQISKVSQYSSKDSNQNSTGPSQPIGRRFLFGIMSGLIVDP
jgi:hypothetical protein